MRGQWAELHERGLDRGAGLIDPHPWDHPFLTARNIARFRSYSEVVWSLATTHRRRSPRALDIAFAVNMAQNMYKWAKLCQQSGSRATLYLHPHELTAINRPEWDEFDGEWADPLDGEGFISAHPSLALSVPCVEPVNEGGELWTAYSPAGRQWWKRFVSAAVSRVAPESGLRLFSDRAAVERLRRQAPMVRHRPLLEFRGMYPYLRWAQMLSRHEVVYVASTPFPAFASGRPYCIFSVGGDLQYDCGRWDDHGRAMRRAFSASRFILASNPHTLGHCRRFGLTNAVYLPYPMDCERFSPGPGRARQAWRRQFGGEIFILATTRLDAKVKGYGPALIDVLARVARARPEVRFITLGWGSEAKAFEDRVARDGLARQVLVLPTVGKLRLLDYYRSADIVIDQLVYGYYGTSALEAAATGRPVVMRIRREQYSALYGGDPPPLVDVSNEEELYRALLELTDSAGRRSRIGAALRDWVVRNHGEQRTVPLLLALLQVAADQVTLAKGVENPLEAQLSREEREYHRRCRAEGSIIGASRRDGTRA